MKRRKRERERDRRDCHEGRHCNSITLSYIKYWNSTYSLIRQNEKMKRNDKDEEGEEKFTFLKSFRFPFENYNRKSRPGVGNLSAFLMPQKSFYYQVLA
jgi:hypothetical protein